MTADRLLLEFLNHQSLCYLVKVTHYCVTYTYGYLILIVYKSTFSLIFDDLIFYSNVLFNVLSAETFVVKMYNMS